MNGPVDGLTVLTVDIENPIWTFAKKWDLNNTYSNYSSILTYNETGYTDYTSLLDEFETMYEGAAEQAGILLKENLQDQTARTGLALAGWKPKKDDMKRQAVEWWEWGTPTMMHVLVRSNDIQTGKMPTPPRKAPSFLELQAKISPSTSSATQTTTSGTNGDTIGSF